MKWNHTKFLMSAFLLSLVACSDDNTAGVTEDGNPAIAQGKSSSSAISSSGAGTTSTVDLWDGSAGEAHVNTGNKNVGNWYSFGDNTAGGLSMLRYPVNLDNEDSDNLSPVIQYCEGLCGTIELNNPVAAPWAGVGFAVAEEGSTADISAWEGLCVTYASDIAVNVSLGVAGDDSLTLPEVTFPKTVKGAMTLSTLMASDNSIVRCAKWSDFKIPNWAKDSSNAQVGKAISGDEAAKRARSVLFKFIGKSSQTVNFNIKKVSLYDENLPKWSESVQLPEVEKNVNTPLCMWKGTDGYESVVNTGFDPDGKYRAGYWYSFGDGLEGGTSTVDWEVPIDVYPDEDYLEPVVAECGGLCGKMYLSKGTRSEALAGIGFDVAGVSDLDAQVQVPKIADISDWGGLCVTYASDLDMHLEFGVDTVADAFVETLLPKSASLVEKCIQWSEISGGEAAAKKVRNIRFVMKNSVDTVANFNIVAIGKYSASGSCSVRLPSSSSNAAVSSSSSVSGNSGKFEDSCNFEYGDDLWFGPQITARVVTGLDDKSESSGYWFSIEDKSSAENSKVIWPDVPEEDVYGDHLDVIEYCSGICATIEFRNAYYAGVGFNIAGESHEGKLSVADASGWKGVCVTYASESDIDVVMNNKDSHDFYGLSLLPKYTFPKSTDVVTKCIGWGGFKSVDGEYGDPTTLTSLYFVINGEANTKSRFNIIGLGTYKELSIPLAQCTEKEYFVSSGK